MQQSNNIFVGVPSSTAEEIVLELVRSQSVRIERIVSTGQTTPIDRWYDQDQNEWVIVLKGKAELLFEGSNQIVPLETGDYVHIPAHARHRVVWTAIDEPTVWLAVFYN
jgi:cupin 2 domain-containing protein